MLSRHTGAWQLYLGLAFAAIVLYAPGGVAGVARDTARLLVRGRPSGWQRRRGWMVAGGSIGGAGLSLAIELAYGRAQGAGGPSVAWWFGLELDAAGTLPWAAAGAMLALGAACLLRGRSREAPSPSPERCDA